MYIQIQIQLKGFTNVKLLQYIKIIDYLNFALDKLNCNFANYLLFNLFLRAPLIVNSLL